MIQRSPTACNAAATAAIMAIGDHIDPRDKVSVLIVAESFLTGLMLLIAKNNPRAQSEYLDALTERTLGRLKEQNQ